MSYPAISLATATVGRYRCPQKRLQTARQPPVYPNSSPRIIAPVTPSPPSAALTPSIPVHRWIRDYDDTFEGVARCVAGCQLNVNPLVPIDGNELWLHPGGDSPVGSPRGFTVVRFTAAAGATYDIEYRFEDIDPSTGGDGIDWFVTKGASTLASGVVKNTSTGLLSLQAVQLDVGDDINFIISPKGTAFYDSTGLQATLTQTAETAVPGLSHLALIGLAAALAGLTLVRRRAMEKA